MRALECLLAVADLRSATRAAQHLHLSQPAISHQLAVLEREAGTALLIRERRGVRLTWPDGPPMASVGGWRMGSGMGGVVVLPGS